MSYLQDNFLLTNKTAESLYFNYAKSMPIFDYHCHLSEKVILENKPFKDIFDLWLSGDHYKWRLMRNYGIDERFITGDGSKKDKFISYCKALGTAFGNPLYHWSQMELQEYFDCDLEINEDNAEQIYNICNEFLTKNEVTPQSLIEKSRVKYLFTTNEVFDDLTVFEKIAEKNYGFNVFPAFRADKIVNIESKDYNRFIALLERQTFEINDLSALKSALEARIQEFINVGSKASDISLEKVYDSADFDTAERVFLKRRSGRDVTLEESHAFKGYLTYYFFKLCAKYDVVTELHIGAMRNNNAEMLSKLGLDAGFDSISDQNSISNASKLFDRLNTENALPKTIVFNLNPKMNVEIMALIGCFQDGKTKGKMQYGPAWWFLDNKAGMGKHLSDLTAVGHLATFVGMLTDSRSLLSYPRHHYFRRIVCSYLGELMEKGEITQNQALIGKVIEDVCYNNAVNYFKL